MPLVAAVSPSVVYSSKLFRRSHFNRKKTTVRHERAEKRICSSSHVQIKNAAHDSRILFPQRFRLRTFISDVATFVFESRLFSISSLANRVIFPPNKPIKSSSNRKNR
ncbi:hypothetical protein Q7C36_017018 [Tachysurus vachellii]|uniref:Uncharacterized protein n=1 Tax=Tachysurus vachellii TaxID=175792 RepID=A0AA88S6Y1_TACVA|nr:hypothetical protein Q7C36_017018 [Tachysurus vachellii]